MAEKKVLFEIRDLTKKFPLSKKRTLTAVNKMSFTIYEGEKLGVVGESGCGKSTLGRVILKLYDQTSGKIIYHGKTSDEVSPKYFMDVNLRKYQSDAAELYKKSLAATDKVEAEKLRDEAHAKLESGAEFAGALILATDLPKYVDLLTKSENEMHAAAMLSLEVTGLEENVESNSAFPSKESDNLNAKLIDSINQKKLDIENHLKKADELRELVKVDENTELLPITDKCSDPEYIKYLDSLYTAGIDLCRLSATEMRLIRHDLQMIFQDPAASLDPRQTVGKSIEEALRLNTKLSPEARKRRTVSLLERVGLKASHYDSYPHNLSGGQKQRVGIARSIATAPSFIVLDEAVSALDVSVKAQILQLLESLRAEHNVTYFFITHDLGVAKHFCDRIMVMYLGNICELAPSKELFNNCLHPYTKSLLDSVPRLRFGEDKLKVKPLEGEVPSAINPPEGCPFHTRCDKCMDICSKVRPEYREVRPDHFVACHLYDKKED